jgi:hypothetical protein
MEVKEKRSIGWNLSSRFRQLSDKRRLFSVFEWNIAWLLVSVNCYRNLKLETAKARVGITDVSQANSNYLIGGVMAEETPEQKLARLEAENRALREQVEQRRTGQLRMKVSEKGALSVYGLGRFPVTLYKEQWIRLLDYADEIKSFLKENDQLLKAKQ